MTSAPSRPVVAIRVIVFDPAGRMLLLRRANSEYGDGQWCLPGGKLDYGDTPEGTVAKELSEETGLGAEDVSFLFYQNSPPLAAGKMHCVNLYFRCRPVGTVTLNEESSEFAWLTPQEALTRKPVFGGEEALRRFLASDTRGRGGPRRSMAELAALAKDCEIFNDWHKLQVEAYAEIRPDYVVFAERLGKILEAGCKTSFPESMVQARAKTVVSFAEKVARRFFKSFPKALEKSDFDKTKSAVERFSDLCGARVIVQTTDQVEGVCKFIEANFVILEKDVKHERLGDDRVGYRDTHYVIRLHVDRASVLGISPEEHELFKDLCAELQVRTWAQHAWADPLHDRMYKAPFQHPAVTRRTSNMVSALLEESDRLLSELANEIDGKIANFAASAKPKDLEKEIEIQKLVLEVEPEAAKGIRLPLNLARLYAAKGAHEEVVKLLGPLAKDTQGALRPTLLLYLGEALCAWHRGDSRKNATHGEYQRGIEYLREACALLESKDVRYAPSLRTLNGARGRAVSALAHALSHVHGKGKEAEGLLHQACGYEPDNPYYLIDMVGSHLRHGKSTDLPAVMRTQLRRAIDICLQHAASRVQLPMSCFAAGRMALVLAASAPGGSAVEALSYYARGIRLVLDSDCMADSAVLARECEWIESLREDGDISEEHPYRFAILLLEIGEAVRSGGKPSRKAQAAIGGPVLMVSGGAAAMPAEKKPNAIRLLSAVLTDYSGTVVAGATKCGIPSIVGDLAQSLAVEGKRRFHLMGYRAIKGEEKDEADTSTHPGYDKPGLVKVGGDFSPLQTLQTWIDILDSKIQPSEVRVLGLGGGDLAKFDYCMGLALGAQVGVVVGSGREADALCQDPLWSRLGNLLPLPDDVATVRAFVAPANTDTGSIEPMAAEIHRRYVDKGELPDNMRPWKELDEKFKRSNRHQAAYAVRLLGDAGFQVRKVEGGPVVLADFSTDEIERMAELEHGRWNVERLAAGWRLGPRDNDRLLRPSLVAWKDLPEEEREHDRDAVRAFPEILAKQDLEIRRRG